MNYSYQGPQRKRLPLLISNPHSGTSFPEELCSKYLPEVVDDPKDTDWFLQELYSFAPSIGVGLLSAHWSRYVIDLNRSSLDSQLYDDGRKETGLVRVTDFSGAPIYRDGWLPDQKEVNDRLNKYYDPYHQKLQSLLSQLVHDFGYAILFEAHSIKSVVPTIQAEPFPNFILGNQDGRTCDLSVFDCAKEQFEEAELEFSENQPFKGGYLTRKFGQPDQGIHSLQLEMCQSNYMDEARGVYLPETAQNLQVFLRGLIISLGQLELKR